MIPPVQGIDRFNAAMRRTAKVLPEKLAFVQRFVLVKGIQGTEDRTPVDRGFLRGNWHASHGNPVTAFDEGRATSQVERNVGIAQNAKAFTVSYLTNTAPYARVVESGGFVPKDPETDEASLKARAARRDDRQRARAKDEAQPAHEGGTFVRGGYSLQAPRGMLGITFDGIVKNLDRVLRALKNQGASA